MKFLRDKFVMTVSALSICFLILIGITSYCDNIQSDNSQPQSSTEKIIFSINNKISLVKNVVGIPLNVVQKRIYSVCDEVNSFCIFIFNYSDMKQENQKLADLNSSLKEGSSEYDTLKSKNSELRNQLDFKDRSSYFQKLTCNVIQKNTVSIETYTIDKGSKDGLGKGMLVTTDEGVFGQITSVNRDWSVVEPIGSDKLSIATMVANSNISDINGENKNLNNYSRTKTFTLSEDTDVQLGDIIVTADNAFTYPKGIRIGYVVNVKDDNQTEMKNVRVKSFVDFNSVKQLFVILPKVKSDINDTNN